MRLMTCLALTAIAIDVIRCYLSMFCSYFSFAAVPGRFFALTIMPTEKGRTFVTQSISFHPDLLGRAKQRAERLGLPFSTYVQKCIEKDLHARDPIVFNERDSSELMAAEDPPPADKPRSRSTRSR